MNEREMVDDSEFFGTPQDRIQIEKQRADQAEAERDALRAALRDVVAAGDKAEASEWGDDYEAEIKPALARAREALGDRGSDQA